MCLSGILLIPRLAYSYDLGVWSIMEGLLNARTHPNIAFWNSIRFNPFYALLEMLIGVVLARMVMLDTEEDKAKAAKPGLLSSLKVSAYGSLLACRVALTDRTCVLLEACAVQPKGSLFSGGKGGVPVPNSHPEGGAQAGLPEREGGGGSAFWCLGGQNAGTAVRYRYDMEAFGDPEPSGPVHSFWHQWWEASSNVTLWD